MAQNVDQRLCDQNVRNMNSIDCIKKKTLQSFRKITATDVPSNSLYSSRKCLLNMFLRSLHFRLPRRKSLPKKASFQRGLHRGHAAPMGLTAFRFVTPWNCQSSTGGFQPAPCWDFRWIYINPKKRCHESDMKS